MSERERLIEKIDELLKNRVCSCGDGFEVGYNTIADFILSDRKRILDEIEKPLKEALTIPYTDVTNRCRCFDEALKAIARWRE